MLLSARRSNPVPPPSEPRASLIVVWVLVTQSEELRSHLVFVLAMAETPSPQVHTGADPDEDEEVLKHLGPCAKPYLALQDCLIRTNRNWMACQHEVKLLRVCHEGVLHSENKREKAS